MAKQRNQYNLLNSLNVIFSILFNTPYYIGGYIKLNNIYGLIENYCLNNIKQKSNPLQEPCLTFDTY